MIVVQQMRLSPHMCKVCRQGRVPAIDTLLDDDDAISSNRLYLCHHCLLEMFKQVSKGLPVRPFVVAEVEEMEEAGVVALVENEALRAEVEGMRTLLRQLGESMANPL
jgi:hypothetical protein